MTMPSWNRVARWAGYGAFFLLTVLVFVVITFPTERVARFVEHKLSKQLKAKVTIGVLDVNGLSELELTDVVLDFDAVVVDVPKPPVEKDPQDPSGEPEVDQPGGPGAAALPQADEPQQGTSDDEATEDTTAAKPRGRGKLKIDYLRVGTGLIDLLFGDSTDIVVDAELLGGSIENAKITYDGGNIRIEVPHLKNIRLDNNPIVARWMPYDVSGVMSAKIDFFWGGSVVDSKGTLDLTIDETVIRKPSFKTKAYGEFVLTDVNLGTVSTRLVVGKKKDIAVLRSVPGSKDDTVIHVEKFDSTGEDAELVLDERSMFLVRPKRPFADWSLSIQAAFHLTDTFYERVESREGQDESPNKFLRTIAKADKRFQAAEKNGFYGLNCAGLVKKPDCNLAKPMMRVGLKNVSGGGGPDEPQKDEESEPSADDEGGESERPERGDQRPRSGGQRGGPVARDVGNTPENENPSRLNSPGARIGLPTVADAPAEPSQPDANDRVEQIRREREERMRLLREQRSQMMQHGAGGVETPPQAVEYPPEVPILAPDDGMVPEMPVLEEYPNPEPEVVDEPLVDPSGVIEEGTEVAPGELEGLPPEEP